MDNNDRILGIKEIQRLYDINDEQEKEIKKMLAIQKEVSEFLGIDKQLPKLQDIKCKSNK